ncbi:hypothetical protein Q5P01_011445 [Channa striata]|uniref:Uncharacterized protein n=1 Tax=Channa striata TaxID=64152 RepID=A0AA88MTS1_CHASR|nr:hypothetical protein Q5P01_011445 [Channa striata]
MLTLTGREQALQILLTSPAETSLTYGPEEPSIRHNSLGEAGGDERCKLDNSEVIGVAGCQGGSTPRGRSCGNGVDVG